MVFGLGRLQKDARIVARTETGPLIEIAFKGRARDGSGNEMCGFVGEVFQDMRPAGVVMNLGEFKIGSWDDIGPVFTQLFDKQTGEICPFCIIARGHTAESLKTLFKVMQVVDLENAEFFDDVGDALEFLAKKPNETRRDPSVLNH